MENQKAQVRVPATMSEKFKWLKAVLRDSELSASSKNVATALMTFHNDRTGQCNPSQKCLAEAVGLSRRRVNGLVAELRAEGWIEAEGTLGASDYRLVLDRAASATETGDGVELDVPPTSDLTYPYVSSDVLPTSSLTYPYVKPDTHNHTENRPEQPQRETTHSTTAPSAVASEPEVIGLAEVNAAMPDRSETAPSMAANDNVRQEEGETFFGWTIPADIMRQWLAAFPDTNVRGELMRRAEWYAANVPEERRVRVFTSKLREADEKNRQARLTRQENRQADVTAGIKHDEYGRVIGAKNTSRFQL